MEISLVYPHQLFHTRGKLKQTVYLVEDELFFNQFAFHLNKLILHRASMKNYSKELTAEGFDVIYIESTSPEARTEALFSLLVRRQIDAVHYYDPADYLLERRIRRYAARTGITLTQHTSPAFICDQKEIAEYFDSGKKYFLATFYEAQRKKRDILMDGKQPAGGRWSLDTENRKPLPRNVSVPIIKENKNAEIAVARKWVAKHYSDNYGSDKDFYFPVTRKEALKALDHFLKERFENFGAYQDAMVWNEHFLFHSVLSSSINSGLLLPNEVLQKALKYASAKKVPLNSVEGFVRQILGWREYIRAVYIREGVRQRKRNFMGFTRKIPHSFYEGETGIAPIDSVIKKVIGSAYAHHIERLMILGNFMLLCEFHPDEVYRWFMELFIDAYDWVMVPNVYGMSQFADGGLMSTKPYFSSSNYVLKMSDFKKGPWCGVWDALFWRFMHVHRDMIARNPRMAILLKTFDTMPAAKRKTLLAIAENFLERLDKGEKAGALLF